jgi:hypothetical protein
MPTSTAIMTRIDGQIRKDVPVELKWDALASVDRLDITREVTAEA